MTTYKILEKEFNKKVKALQKECKHEKTEWYEQWWAIGHSSGFRVQICLKCNKKLAEDPTAEEREKAKKEWRDKEMKKHKGLKIMEI